MSLADAKPEAPELPAGARPDKLPELQQALHRFARESQDIFLDIARRFPELEKKINDEIDEATAVINHFFWNLEPGVGQGLAGNIEKHKVNLLAVNQGMETLLKKDQSLLAGLFDCIQKTRNIESHLGDIRGLAKDIKVHAINSIIVSAKSGQSGEGYRALSKFFILFSNRARAQIEDLADNSRRFFSLFDAYESDVKKLAREDAALLTHTSATFESTFQKLLESFRNFSLTLHDLFDRVGKNRGAIRGLINRMQEQDILQQQLLHVVQVFEQLESEARGMPPVRAAALTTALCELNQRQLAAIRLSVRSLTESTEQALSGMRENLQMFNEDRDLIYEYMAKDGAIGEEKAAIDRLLDRSTDFLRETVEKFQGSLERKRHAGSSSTQLAAALDALEPFFKRLRELTEVFAHMNFMAKKEVAQYDVFRRAGTSLSGDVMDRLSGRMKEVLDRAELDYDRSRDDLDGQLSSFITRIAHQEKALAEMSLQTHEAMSTLDQTRQVLKESLGNVSHFATDLQQEVESALTGVQRLGKIVADLAQLEAAMEKAKRDAMDLVSSAAAGGQSAPPVTGSQVEPFLRNYSVAKEREIARELFPDLPEDTGSASSRVELF